MPTPAAISLTEGKLIIDGSFSVHMSSYSDAQLDHAVTQFAARVSRQTGIPFTEGQHATLTVECRSAAPDYPTLGEDESYQLEITPQGARLLAPSVTGILRGLETFSQLITQDARSFYVPALHIEDRPRFPWRGLMLDVSRHWMPLPVILRNLDAMAAVKFNVFHWHLSDDQGFRVESKLFPKLQQLGSDGNFYTQAEVRSVIAYARNLGIRVVPEFDVPGHTTCWFVGYPELASVPGPFQIERRFGIFEPTLDVSSEQVYTFLDSLLGEMAGLFPDPYFHIGGDEVKDREWRENPAIQAFSVKNGIKNSLELHAYFNRRIQQILTKHGKKMVGWDEVLAPGLSNDVVIQSWRGQKSLRDAAQKGYRGILSFGYYLDHVNTAAFHYQVDPLDAEAKELSPEQAALILGGEACMWTEYVNEETVDSRLWPRAAAIAERLWSPADVTDAESMYKRLETVSRWLDWFGVEHRSDYGRMLNRLAGGTPVPALRVLGDSVEALGIDVRQEARRYSSFVPLNRLADAARPESESVRDLSESLQRLLAGTANHREDMPAIRVQFTEWSENNTLLKPLFQSNFLLGEVAPVSENLSKTGAIGLRALQFLESGERAPAEWVAEQKKELSRMEQPQAEVVLAAVRPVRALLDAVSQPTAQGAKAGGSERDK
jgi:hexosaminidase